MPSILIVYAVIKIFGYNGLLNSNFNIYEYLHIDSIYGIKAIIQPGGSIRDRDSINACNELGLSMIFTGKRHFLH